jgi:tRNA dimethylallyltransferase
MHSRLTEVDPASAARIHPNDTQRIQRALEVFTVTQIPLSILWDDTKPAPSFRFMNLVIMPEDRRWLHERIAIRFQQMLAEGLIDEVAQLIKTWSLTAMHPSMKSVGYRQVFSYLQGEYDEKTLVEKGIAATRQLAKRQLTWLRHWPEKQGFTAENPSIFDEMIRFLGQTGYFV